MESERMSARSIAGIGLAVLGGLTAAHGIWGIEHYSSLLDEEYTDPYGRVFDPVDGVAYSRDALEGLVATNRVVTPAGLVALLAGAGLTLTRSGPRRGSFQAALQAA